jgi:hypothetical protein
MIFTLMFAGASLFGMDAPGDGPGGWISILFLLFDLPFLAIGLILLGAPAWAQKRRLKTVYTITNQRAIVFDAPWWKSSATHIFAPNELGSVTRKERADGSGDVVLRTNHSQDSDGTHSTTRTGFLGIANVRQVEEMLRALANTARP